MSETPVTREKRQFLNRIKEARIGDPNAQYDVALMYANGVGVTKNLAQALVWAETAAEKGHSSAQYLLGRTYQQGLGTAKDHQKALVWYLRASEKGNDKAALKLALTCAKPQEEVAFHYAIEAANSGLAEAQLTVGNYFEKGIGVEPDLAQAVMWYERAAQQDFAAAQYLLGNAFEQGAGIECNLEEAVRWYRQAASQGLPAAQLALSRLDSVMGRGSDPDTNKINKRQPARENRSVDSRWIKFASKGDSEDFYHLGIMFETGVGVEKSGKQARLWYQKAAEDGHRDAMVALGQMQIGTAPNQAANWFIKAAELGQPDAQFAIAESLSDGIGINKDGVESLYWYALAAKQGHCQSQYALSRLLQEPRDEITKTLVLSAAHGGVASAQFDMGERSAGGIGFPQDWYQACQWYQLAAEQEIADAQCALASCYAQGRGIKKDLSKSFLWYEKAAAQGNARAQWNLGELYAVGVPGVQPDAKQAMLMCKRAANAGFAPAQATLGTLFAKTGKQSRAVEWWTLAAEQGDFEAQFNLASAYISGQGVEKNEAKAFDLLMTSAKMGGAAAQARIGLAYATGVGAVLDLIEAARWFILAASNGDKAAAANMEKSKSILSPAQWAEANRRAHV